MSKKGWQESLNLRHQAVGIILAGKTRGSFPKSLRSINQQSVVPPNMNKIFKNVKFPKWLRKKKLNLLWKSSFILRLTLLGLGWNDLRQVFRATQSLANTTSMPSTTRGEHPGEECVAYDAWWRVWYLRKGPILKNLSQIKFKMTKMNDGTCLHTAATSLQWWNMFSYSCYKPPMMEHVFIQLLQASNEGTCFHTAATSLQWWNMFAYSCYKPKMAPGLGG